MNRQTNTIVAILIIVLALTIYFAYRWTNHDKEELNSTSISKVTICKALPFCDSTVFLTRQQTEDFVKKWNTSNSIGYNKYQCQYYIEVYLNNTKKRTFCSLQDQILEGSTNGWVFTIGNKNYFDSLYHLDIATLSKHQVDKVK
jgi:hypothetical protein